MKLFFYSVITSTAFSQATHYEGIGITGDPAGVTTTSITGFVLAGGSTNVDEVFKWMIKRSGRGDFL